MTTEPVLSGQMGGPRAFSEHVCFTDSINPLCSGLISVEQCSCSTLKVFDHWCGDEKKEI